MKYQLFAFYVFCGGKKVIETKLYKMFTFTDFFFFFLKGWNFSYTNHWLNCPILTEACQDIHVFLQLNDAIILTNKDFVLHKQMHAHYTTFLKFHVCLGYPYLIFIQFVY